MLRTKDKDIKRLKSEASSSSSAVAEVEHLRFLLKSTESAHMTEVSSLKERFSKFEAELRE